MAAENSASGTRVLITGVTGQDGYYLAREFLDRGHDVAGAVRSLESPGALQVKRELPGIELVPFDLLDEASVSSALEATMPDRIFHLAGMSHVGEAWRRPVDVLEVNAAGTLRLLEAMRRVAPSARLVFAGSGDCMDHEAAAPEGITPETPLKCTNPYSVSKAAAMQSVQCYREQYGLHASVAILMNHTSPRRSTRFVERKIVHQAVEVAHGRADAVKLGSLEASRDWSWAEDVVLGLAALGDCDEPGDFVFASGRLHTTGDWVRLTFERLGLDEGKHLEIDPGQSHGGDRAHTFGDISPAVRELGWAPKTEFETMVERLIEAEVAAAPIEK